MITRPKIPKIDTQNAFLNFYVESKFQLSRFNCLLVISNSIFICKKFPTKPKIQRYNAKSQAHANAKSQLGWTTKVFQPMYSIGYPKKHRGEQSVGGIILTILLYFYYYSTVEVKLGPMG